MLKLTGYLIKGSTSIIRASFNLEVNSNLPKVFSRKERSSLS